MKILMISHYMLPHRGGIEIIIEKLSSALAGEGHEVRIVAGSVEASSRRIDGNREILGYHVFDPLKRYGVHYPLFPPSALKAIHEGVLWADVVHAQGMLYINSLLAAWLARASNRPTVLTEHAGFVPYSHWALNWSQRVAVNSIGKLTLAQNDRIVVPDQIVADILIDDIRVPSQKIVKIPLGIDAEFFRPIDAQSKERLRAELQWDSKPKILFIGNFVARKRIELLLKTACDRFDIVLCGEGTPPSPLPKQVKLYPAQDHGGVLRLYQASDLFVVPSSVETFSIVAYEAMACGLPVLMTDDLRHLTIAQSGLVHFVPANCRALLDAILGFVDDPSKTQRIGRLSADWVRENYSWRRTVNEHLLVYTSVLNASFEDSPTISIRDRNH